MINYAKDTLKIYQGNWVDVISCGNNYGYGNGNGYGHGDDSGYGYGDGYGSGYGRKLSNGLETVDD